MSPSNIEILAYEESPLGPLCLRRRELLSDPGTVVTEITLNHAFLMSSCNTASERALSETALSVHAAGRARASESGTASDPNQKLRVLIGGLGLGYSAQAALASNRVGQVDVVELLPQVMDWLAQGLVPLSDELNSDPRFRPIPGDIYAILASGERAASALQSRFAGGGTSRPEDESLAPVQSGYDLILIDVDHSPDDRLGGESAAFYTAKGLRAAKSHLANGGVLGIWSYAESSPLSEALREVFENVQVVPVRFLNKLVDQEEVDWLFFAT